MPTYAIYHKGRLHGQTTDFDQYEFLLRLYKSDGCKPDDLKTMVFADGQDVDERYSEAASQNKDNWC